jgi:hypothetical protein
MHSLMDIEHCYFHSKLGSMSGEEESMSGEEECILLWT